MSDQEILDLAERHCGAFLSPTSNYTGDEVYILTPEELIDFVRDLRTRTMREVE